MADFTTHYNLEKPLDTEFYDIGVQNTNMDRVDNELKSINDNIDSVEADIVGIENSITGINSDISDLEAAIDDAKGLSVIKNISIGPSVSRGDCIKLDNAGDWQKDQTGTRAYDGVSNGVKVGVVGGFAGLDVGYTYYFDENGSPQLGVTNYVAGEAVSLTEIDFRVEGDDNPSVYEDDMIQYFAVVGKSSEMKHKIEMSLTATGVMIRKKATAWGSGDDITTGSFVINITDDTNYKDANDWYHETGLTDGVVWYYKAFPQLGGIYNETIGVNESEPIIVGGLVRGYNMDDISGATVNDEVGAANGNAINVVYSTGKVINGAVGNGSSSRITATSIALGTPFTVECWFNLASGGLFGNTGVSDGFGAHLVDTLLKVGRHSFYASTTISLNTTYHLITVWDGTGTTIYLDGVSVAYFAGAQIADVTDMLRCPNVSNVDQYADGWIDSFRIYNRSLTINEITALYNGGAGC